MNLIQSHLHPFFHNTNRRPVARLVMIGKS